MLKLKQLDIYIYICNSLPFQERRAIARAHTHTCAKVLRRDKLHAQMKLLATSFSYLIACVSSRYMTVLYMLKTTFLLISLL